MSTAAPEKTPPTPSPGGGSPDGLVRKSLRRRCYEALISRPGQWMNSETLRVYLGEDDRVVVDVQLTCLALANQIEHAAGMYRSSPPAFRPGADPVGLVA